MSLHVDDGLLNFRVGEGEEERVEEGERHREKAFLECLIQAYQTSPKSPRSWPRQQLIKFAVSECYKLFAKIFKTLPLSLFTLVCVCVCVLMQSEMAAVIIKIKPFAVLFI